MIMSSKCWVAKWGLLQLKVKNEDNSSNEINKSFFPKIQPTILDETTRKQNEIDIVTCIEKILNDSGVITRVTLDKNKTKNLFKAIVKLTNPIKLEIDSKFIYERQQNPFF